MPYNKITLEAVVDTDTTEAFIQALDNAMDEIEDKMTVYSSEIKTQDSGVPENASCIAEK